MCAIFGVVVLDKRKMPLIRLDTMSIATASSARGRDSWGIAFTKEREDKLTVKKDLGGLDPSQIPENFKLLIGSCRAEPTTEWVHKKRPENTHPFMDENWAIVHNGVVSNDKEFADNVTIDSEVIPGVFSKYGFTEGLRRMKGSFAILALKSGAPNSMIGFRDYKPLVAFQTDYAIFFASKAEYFPEMKGRPIEIPPYSTVGVDSNSKKIRVMKQPRESNRKAYVICSGGLDSTTVATLVCHNHQPENVTLLHFLYGCQAEKREVEAVRRIAKSLGCHCQFEDLSFIKKLGGNALTDPSIEVSESVAGAEYAHEWVPFRNGVMISLTAALCDRNDIQHIYLGLNLEEGGAFPDNTEEFYQRFNQVLDLGSISRPVISNPLGNLMKHEIVKLALRMKAPIKESWSCYRGGDIHCGRCAPCYMRRTAFQMNGLQDMIPYEH